MKNLKTLPKLRDSLSFVYFEHARLEREKNAVSIFDKEGETHVPVAALGTVMLGPGTTVTHEAMKVLAENGCSVLWVGEHGVRMYAQGMGETRSALRLLRQADIHSTPQKRMAVVLKMYAKRFDEDLDPELSLEQIRGKEGVRVRTAYSRASERWGVEWNGRNYSRGDWSKADPVNRALSTAASCLYGICHCAIVSAGYSPSIGFIHTGKLLSFVYDIADLYKVETTIPVAFEIASRYQKLDGLKGMERDVRLACRNKFHEQKVLERVVRDIDDVLDVSVEAIDNASHYLDDENDPPGGIWDPAKGQVDGGQNYGSDCA
ncbi:MAG: type I-E CRISPR-associated endonuclease Cas1e [Polyangia bacterium]